MRMRVCHERASQPSRAQRRTLYRTSQLPVQLPGNPSFPENARYDRSELARRSRPMHVDDCKSSSPRAKYLAPTSDRHYTKKKKLKSPVSLMVVLSKGILTLAIGVPRPRALSAR